MKGLTVFLLVSSLVSPAVSDKLLLILLDGFRWDYFQRDLDLEGFKNIFRRGVKLERLIPVYPSVSYPNHYAIMTGQYAETHGIVGNEVYDETTDKMYNPFSDKPGNLSSLYNDSEPLWITAVKQHKRVYMFHYYGCQVRIRGRLSTYCRKYQTNPSVEDFQEAVDDSLNLFKNSSADLAVIYYDRVDDYGHRYGPNSSEVNSAIKNIDTQLTRMVRKMDEMGLDEEVDVMIFSDHGMTDVSPSRVTNVSDVIPASSCKRILNGYGPYVFIWPKEGRESEVYNALKKSESHYTTYLKKDIPDRWHFRNNSRIPPILLVADIPWILETPGVGFYEYATTGAIRGEHGYDPMESDMSGIFTAFGPSFQPGVKGTNLANVNLYQIMCKILGIEHRPHNGSWSRVSHMMRTFPSTNAACQNVFSYVCLLVVLSCVCMYSKIVQRMP